MDRTRIFKYLVNVSFGLFIVNFIGDKFYWYYTIWWFDMLIHFFGGVLATIALIWIIPEKFLEKNLILKLMIGVLIVGIGIEILEYFQINFLGGDHFNILDTLSDIFFDLTGGLCAILYIWKKQLK